MPKTPLTVPPPRRSPELRALLRWLAAPTIGLVLFVALMTSAFFYLQRTELEQQRQALYRDLEWAQQALRIHWRSEFETVAAAASDWARVTPATASPHPAPGDFLGRYPDVAWLGWIDAERRVRWLEAQPSAMPPASHAIGGQLEEPAGVQAFREATEGRIAAWSEPFAGPDGVLMVEMHVPVARGGAPAGTVVVAYPLARVFEIGMADETRARYKLDLVDPTGKLLATTSPRAIRDAKLSYELPLDPPGHGIRLRAFAFEAQPQRVERLLYLAVMGLSIAILASLGLLWRAVRQRMLAQADRDWLFEKSLAEAAFRRAMDDSMLTGMRAFDLEGRVTYVNRAFCRMTGFEAHELVGTVAPYPYWTDDELANQAATLERMLAGKVPPSGVEVRLKRRDGTAIDTRMYVSPLVDRGGRQTGWMTSVTDITEPRRIRGELAAAHERFTTVLDEIDAAVSVLAVDAAGSETLLFANPMYRRLFGADPSGHRSLRPDDVGGARAATGVVDAARPADAGAPVSGSPAEVWSPATQRWFEVRTRPILWVDGRLVEILVATDVTARRVALDRQRQQDEKLAHTSRLVTMGEMASSLAHEMNQPLAAITNYVSGLSARVRDRVRRGVPLDPDEIVDALGKTGRQAERAGEVIRRIREFVRRSEPAREACEASAIVADALGLAEIDARRHRVRVIVELPEALPRLWADPILIEQVLLNLMKNAIEAMRTMPTDGGITPERLLRVTVRDLGEQVEFAVADTGPGIALELRDRLFDAFYTTKAEGMGMGLNICRTIVEFHEGRLWVDAAPGGGCVFRFTLPLAGAGAGAGKAAA